MKSLLSFIFCLGTLMSMAQAPILYVNIVSHNEPSDTMQLPMKYAKAKSNMLQFANIIDTRNAKWTIQTSDGLVMGALTDQANTSTNIFKTLATAPYADNIEIDPRYKNMAGRNIADQYYLLDSLGANPTTNLGGCIYTTSDSLLAPIDWEQYRNPIHGNIYNVTWQCSKLTGAGSYPPHQNDLRDFGIFKPDTANNFYHHNASKNLWCMGVGCAPVLDSMDSEQAIIDLIQAQVDSIQNGLWPQNKFYVTRIMTNQREYGPMFLQKITKVIDSLNLIPTTKLRWATINETFDAFQLWQTASGQDHSQWLCGQNSVGTIDVIRGSNYELYPNPTQDHITLNFLDQNLHDVILFDASGRPILTRKIRSTDRLYLNGLPSGIYFLQCDHQGAHKICKE